MKEKERKQKELWTKFENHILNEGVSKRRRQKHSQMFNTVIRYFKNKPLESLERKDLEQFVNALNRNDFKQRDGDKYLGTTKQDIKKFLKYFWKWLKGDNEEYPPEVKWIKTRISKEEKPKQKDVISMTEAQQLANRFERIEYKMLTLMLFDSGFRISEMLSVRKMDLTFEEFDGAKKCFWIKCNESKTYTRKIPIPLFTEDIQQFVNSTYYQNLRDNDLLFQRKYRIIHKSLMLKAKEVLNRPIAPHLFRHSSATFWARELEGNTVALAQRFGWSLTATEIKTYVRMSGAFERGTAKKSYENETVKLKERVAELEEELNSLKGFKIKVEALLKNPEKFINADIGLKKA